ncbi:MAG: hypothetical protein WB630_00895, partial [Candidatus Acidiferrales bacterium]
DSPITEHVEKRFPYDLKAPLQSLRTITGATGPRFGSIIIAATAPVVRVLNLGQFEVLLPIGLLFLQRSRTVANLDPTRRTVFAKARVVHVSQIFPLRD